MAKNSGPDRRRFSPEKCKSLILDHTADIVARDGVAQLSVEQIGKEAGISKSLVYAYSPNLTELLRALYQREMRRIRRAQSEAADGATTFEGLVRSITHAYLSHMHARLYSASGQTVQPQAGRIWRRKGLKVLQRQLKRGRLLLGVLAVIGVCFTHPRDLAERVMLAAITALSGALAFGAMLGLAGIVSVS